MLMISYRIEVMQRIRKTNQVKKVPIVARRTLLFSVNILLWSRIAGIGLRTLLTRGRIIRKRRAA